MQLSLYPFINDFPLSPQLNTICQASEPDASKYCARVQERIAQLGEWDELTLVDATPHEMPRADTVAAARAGDRVFPGEDEWRGGQVVDVSEGDDGTTHTVSFKKNSWIGSPIALRSR